MIRNATPDDVPTIFKFITELAEYEKLAHEVTADENALAATLFGERPAAEVILIEDGQGPVGFALFFTSYSTFLARPGIYLEDLYVRPECRGRGYGRALLRHLAAEALRRGGGRLEWSVLDWNEPSIRFYESLNARPMSDWIRYRIDGEALHRLASE